MVTMAALLKLKGLFTFLLSTFSSCSNGFNIFFNRWSVTASAPTVQKCFAFCCLSFSASFAASFGCGDDVVWGLFGWESVLERVLGKRLDSGMVSIVTGENFGGDGLSRDCARLICTI